MSAEFSTSSCFLLCKLLLATCIIKRENWSYLGWNVHCLSLDNSSRPRARSTERTDAIQQINKQLTREATQCNKYNQPERRDNENMNKNRDNDGEYSILNIIY